MHHSRFYLWAQTSPELLMVPWLRWVPKVLEPYQGGTDDDGLPPDFDLLTRSQRTNGPWDSPDVWSDGLWLKGAK